MFLGATFMPQSAVMLKQGYCAFPIELLVVTILEHDMCILIVRRGEISGSGIRIHVFAQQQSPYLTCSPFTVKFQAILDYFPMRNDFGEICSDVCVSEKSPMQRRLFLHFVTSV